MGRGDESIIRRKRGVEQRGYIITFRWCIIYGWMISTVKKKRSKLHDASNKFNQ